MTERGIPADTALSATLTAAEWVAVRRLVGRGAHDDVAALLVRLEAQLTAAIQPTAPAVDVEAGRSTLEIVPAGSLPARRLADG